MFSSLRRWIMIVLIVLWLAVIVTFVTSNLHPTAISLFPLPFSAEVPVYLLCLVMLGLGYVLASLKAKLRLFQQGHQLRKQEQKCTALSDELRSIKAEYAARPATSHPQMIEKRSSAS